MSRHPMAVAAGRVLSKRTADACNVDADDYWETCGESFLEDAQAALDACGALELLAALKMALAIIGHPDDAASQHIASVIAAAEGQQ